MRSGQGISSGWRVDGGAPRAGRHYPRSFAEFEVWFSNEERCAQYLTDVRWRNGLGCPRCGSVRFTLRPRRRWWCADCRRSSTVTSGTLLEATKVPLSMWLSAAWYFTNEKNGVSARSIERALGVHYGTAWAMLHKLRCAVDQQGRTQLTGDVEIDETFLGGREPGKPGRSYGKKAVIVIAAESRIYNRIGRIRIARIEDASAESLRAFIRESVEPGSVILTDGWSAYKKALRGQPYLHKPTNIKRSKVAAHVVMPHVHRVASLLKRWILGTHQGAPLQRHIDAYLDEFVFRFNRRTSTNRGLLFYRLVCSLLETPPVPRADIIGGTPLPTDVDVDFDEAW